LSKLLVIDTSAAHCAVAVFSGTVALVERAEPMSRGHAERLMPMVAEVLGEGGLSCADLDAIVACTGPGGFTGARIGVAAARGLALGCRARAMGVDWFEAAAHGLSGRVAVLIEGPAGARWIARYRDGVAVGPAATADPGAAAADLAPGEVLVRGDAGVGRLLPLARVAARRLAGGAVGDRPAPLYLRPPDAVAAAAPLAARRA
jgi:tRNA threonylcarbamoyl adenosine modification protein YeaZ